MRKLIATLLLLMLSFSAMGAALTLPASAAPEDNIKVLSYSWYTYPESGYGPGDLIVVGEIQNVGSSVLDRVLLRGMAFTAEGPQADALSQAYVEYMEPQQKAPFYMDFNPMGQITNMTWASMINHIEIYVALTNETEVRQFSDVQAVGNTAYPDPNNNGLYTVTGVLKNNGAEPSPNRVWVVTTFYDATGTVVAINETASPLIKQPMNPGESATFYATPRDYTQLTKQIASHSVLVQTREIASPTPTPTQTSASPTPIGSNPQTTSPPAGTQSPISMDTVYIAAIIAVAAIVVVVIMMLSRRRR